MASQHKLYAHEPRTLIPLLREHMPHSVVLIGTIVANPTSEGSALPALPPVYATFPPLESGGDITSASLAENGVGKYDWLVTVALPAPSVQFRFYHALTGAPDSERTQELFDTAAAMIKESLREMQDRYSTRFVLGGVHDLFVDVAREVLGGPRRTSTYLYLAPNGGAGPTAMDDSNVKWEDELELGLGKKEDAELIHSTNPYRTVEYYAARAPSTTTLRPRGGGAAAAWVMTHGDGSLGALWTQPEYRRRGLAKVILAEHVRRQEADGIPGFCYVEEDNEASMRLWEGLNWTRLPFTMYWVYADGTGPH